MVQIRRVLRDWPGVVTLVLFLVVGACTVAAFVRHWPWLLPFRADELDSSTVASIYLGLAAVGAIYAGFAGVIIVFGLTPTSDLFRTFRLSAGDRMVSNWISVIASGFVGSGLSLSAAVLEVLGSKLMGSALFVIGALLLIHSAGRSVWILTLLLKLVKADDQQAEQRRLTQNLGNPFGNP
ncbi:UNVERIFIED_ORG: hypothetical protein M2328_005940 [Rhodococcus erythropolis]